MKPKLQCCCVCQIFCILNLVYSLAAILMRSRLQFVRLHAVSALRDCTTPAGNSVLQFRSRMENIFCHSSSSRDLCLQIFLFIFCFRMRAKTNDFLKILNRAKIEDENNKKVSKFRK